MIEHILRGVSDDRRVMDRRPGASPMKDLVDSYQKKAEQYPELRPLDETSTGKDLKDAISQLPMEDQVQLLGEYCRDTLSLHDPFTYESPKERDERRLRIWIIKAVVTLTCVMVVLVIGAAMALGHASGDVSGGPLVNTVLSTAVEILKLIFASNLGTA